MENLNNILKILLENNVEFILVGGFAGVLYGSSHVTRDIDICALITGEQIEKLRTIFKDYNPVHRMTIDKKSFLDIPQNVEGTKNIFLSTDLGVLDILSNIEGVGDYNELAKTAVEVQVRNKNSSRGGSGDNFVIP
ncbi:MAG: nucleotidyltransferase [Oligoflexia bacterium]|nr:nucleotidyltransferase [Oligoflexia bacterium]